MSEINEVELLKKQTSFECTVRYPLVPLIYIYGSMFSSYEKNVYAESLGIKYLPRAVILMSERYETWLDISSKVKISDSKLIKRVEKDTTLYRKEAEERLGMIIDELDIYNSKKDLARQLEEVNNISRNIYYYFDFFIDELFETSEEKTTYKLQEIRMNLDRLVTKYLFRAYDKIIDILISKYKLSKNIAKWATTDEILIFLKGEKIDQKKIINRKIAFIFLNGKKYTFFDEKAENIKKFLKRQDPGRDVMKNSKRKRLLVGKIGNKGKVRGRVVKLLAEDYFNEEKINNLGNEKDYIFVTSMTVPEIVPQLKNSLGFITDEGGVTCHAAIISRELNIPCIIGTKIATQVLKDGDEVEIDAEKGIVKILKRKYE